ncbi:MAG: DUF4070 domain-containing protein, partial [Chloroflexota bacterium]
QREDRLLEERNMAFYNGYNVTFKPKYMNPDELLQAHRDLWNLAFSPKHSLRRIARGRRYLRTGAFAMSMFMNGFYGLKQLRGNTPIDIQRQLIPNGTNSMQDKLETQRQGSLLQTPS